MLEELDLVLRDSASGQELGREPLPCYARERLIADAHMEAILAGELPNDGAPIRVEEFAVEAVDGGFRIHVEVGADGVSYRKSFSQLALRDDAEIIAARLIKAKRSEAPTTPLRGETHTVVSHPAAPSIDVGVYRFNCTPRAAVPDSGGGLQVRPMPRRLRRLRPCSLWQRGVTSLPRCRHPALLLPRDRALGLVAQARASASVEVGALLLVEPFLIEEPLPHRLGVWILDVVPLAHGTHGDRTHLKITPDALAAVAVDENRGRHRGGLSHSHVFGDQLPVPHLLSLEDKAMASGLFWLPYQLQIVVDPRFAAPEDALAAFCWVNGALARVCINLVEA